MEQTKHLNINFIKTIMTALVLIVLFKMPKTFFGIPHFYSIHFETRTIANQGELFGITFVEVILIMIALFLYFQNEGPKTRYWLLLLVVIMTNLIRFLAGMTNPISYHSYEIILAMIVALSCGTIIEYFYKTPEELMNFMDMLVFLFFIFQLMFIAIGKGKNGSFGTLGMAGGGLATCYATYMIIKLMTNTKGYKNTVLIIMSVIGLLLTGSRTQMMLFLIFFGFYFLFMTPYASTKKFIAIGLIALFIALSWKYLVPVLMTSKKIAGLTRIFTSGLYAYITGDASAGERFKTWVAALTILKTNPLGISCSVVDLQNRMFAAGSTTFPHSYLLSYWLLFGVPGLVIYASFIKRIFASRKHKTGLTMLFIYLGIVLTFYGGFSAQYMFLFWLMMLFSLEKRKEAALETVAAPIRKREAPLAYALKQSQPQRKVLS